ncbi:MAG: cation:proton antiporter subunit C [Candidatus Saganbacteria bacterium]|nr:cation:proton antiporter subunit C [Candidatus Saganbacteria bacterium]
MAIYFLCFLLFLIGLFGIITKKNLIKMVVSLVVCEYALNLFIVLVGYKRGGEDPLILQNMGERLSVDPLPQTMVLTTIVIGLALLILLVALCIRIYEKYGTLDITEIKKLKG